MLVNLDGTSCPVKSHTVAKSVATQAGDLRCLEGPGATRRKVAEADRADPNADESVDRGADGAEHASELALPALGQRRPVPDKRRIGRRSHRRHELRGLGSRGRPKRPGEPSDPL